MKKKLIVTIIVLLFAILLTGCSSEEAQKNVESFQSGLNSVIRDPSVAFSQEAEIQTTENQFIFVWTDKNTIYCLSAKKWICRFWRNYAKAERRRKPLYL